MTALINVCLILSILIMCFGTYTVIRRRKQGRGDGFSLPFFTGCLVIAATINFYPLQFLAFGSGFVNSVVKGILVSLDVAIKLFVVDADYEIVTDFVEAVGYAPSLAYEVWSAVLFVLAPVLTFGYVLAAFAHAGNLLKVRNHSKRETFVFSELNGRTLALAKDIYSNDDKRLIIFAGVDQENENSNAELKTEASKIKAVCLKEDITAVNLKKHKDSFGLHFFVLSYNEENNLAQAMELMEAYKDKKNTGLYLFSDSIESEMIVKNYERGTMKVRRISPSRAFVENYLYENGNVLFDTAVSVATEGTPQGDAQPKKHIGAVIVGLGSFGLNMFKGLTWFTQMDGYEARIDGFDIDPKSGEYFKAECPELMSEALNGRKIDGECEVDLHIHSGIDALSSAFTEELKKIKNVTYVFISLGNDSLNVKTAVAVRTFFERQGAKPVIVAVASVKAMNEILGSAQYRKKAYNIIFTGDHETNYSERIIMGTELEEAAFRLHCKWGEPEEFWNDEYNYHSSVASVIHQKTRNYLNVTGANRTEAELDENEKRSLAVLEHKRWNAYMRSEGYVYSGSTTKASRNDLAKMHQDLVPFDMLNAEEKAKDVKVGTK